MKMERGQLLATAVGGYMILKAIINGIIGGGINLISLLVAVAATVCLFFGVKWSNIVVGIVLVALFCTHFVENVTHLPQNLIYLIEGLMDVGGGVLLAFLPDIRRHCKSNNI
ncbi:MAG: hypothetical protein ACI4J3_05070 [Oscillospiraceae bacterium]